ncbi:MAG: permease [Caldisericota bacterium]|nr:permease [Caldisericota bacterium]
MNILGTIIYSIIVIASYIYAVNKSKSSTKKAFKKGWLQLLKRLPLITAIFLLISLFDVFVPKNIVAAAIGRGKGFFSILLSALFGTIIAGPVSSSYPLGAVLLKKGTTIAVTAVFLNSWVMVGFVTIPFEISIFGKRFTFARNTLAFLGALIIGILTGLILTGSAL